MHRNRILDNIQAFESKYVKPAMLKNVVVSSSMGGVAGGGVVAGTVVATNVAATAAATTAATEAVSSIPLIGGLLGSLGVGSGAAATGTAVGVAAVGTTGLPIAIGAGVAVAGAAFLIQQKKKKIACFNIEDIAAVVGDIVFLPLFGKATEYLQKNSGEKEAAKQFLRDQIIQWGYTEEYIAELIERHMHDSPKQIRKDFIRQLSCVKNIGRKAGYKKITAYAKEQLPIKILQKLATEEARKLDL